MPTEDQEAQQMAPPEPADFDAIAARNIDTTIALHHFENSAKNVLADILTALRDNSTLVSEIQQYRRREAVRPEAPLTWDRSIRANLTSSIIEIPVRRGSSWIGDVHLPLSDAAALGEILDGIVHKARQFEAATGQAANNA